MFSSLGPGVRALLLACIALYAVKPLKPDVLDALALWPMGAGFQPWQLLTYAFLHGTLLHLSFNMIGLVSFGRELEMWWGTRRFLQFYLACVLSAALVQLAVTSSTGSLSPTVGASGGLYGLLLGFAVMFPKRRVLLLIPPIPMPAWVFALSFAVLELVLGVTGTASGIANFAQLGGMLGGGWMLWRWARSAPRD
ncbi:MAG: rhomboid family intramembrane serine protease [Gammaproteobacteria bacterium]